MEPNRRLTRFLPIGSVAQQALFASGFELAGVRLQRFAEALFAAADASPDASIDVLVAGAMEPLDGDAVALVAEERLLCELPLPAPASNVSEAADAAVCALAQRLVDVRRAADVLRTK